MAAPPTAPPGPADTGTGRSYPTGRTVVLAAFGVLLAGVAFVILVLPDWVAPPAEEPPAPVAEAPAPPPPPPAASMPRERAPAPGTAPSPAPGPMPPPAPDAAPAAPDTAQAPDSAALQAARSEAEEALGAWVRRRSTLEALNVADWGGEDYEAVQVAAADADARFAGGDFAGATSGYTRAREGLDALDASRPERLKAALERGADALETGDAPGATEAFETALALDADNDAARRGLARAGTLPQVAALVSEGLELESGGELVKAKAAFEKAVALDAETTPAVEGVARVGAAIEQARFDEAMSAALVALDRGALSEARAALKDAGAIRPDAPSLRDARARLRAADEQRRIRAYRQKAEALERQERWRDALARYDSALAVDSQLQFARAGKARSTRLAELNEAIDGHLASPGRLASAGPRAEAARLVEQARAESGQPRLAEKAGKLDQRLALAATPVPVTLLSDEHTEVTIYRVGRLGAFRTRQVVLRPGRYTAVGHRDGYRDVRVRFDVSAERTMEPIVVQCEERI